MQRHARVSRHVDVRFLAEWGDGGVRTGESTASADRLGLPKQPNAHVRLFILPPQRASQSGVGRAVRHRARVLPDGHPRHILGLRRPPRLADIGRQCGLPTMQHLSTVARRAAEDIRRRTGTGLPLSIGPSSARHVLGRQGQWRDDVAIVPTQSGGVGVMHARREAVRFNRSVVRVSADTHGGRQDERRPSLAHLRLPPEGQCFGEQSHRRRI